MPVRAPAGMSKSIFSMTIAAVVAKYEWRIRVFVNSDPRTRTQHMMHDGLTFNNENHMSSETVSDRAKAD